ncbi:MAG: aldo/keto reductase [Woeseiaceae bacterium]|nr:aldo/keto reductase [Woeseiaceae bacterium]
MTADTYNRRELLGAALALGISPNIVFSESAKMSTRTIPGTDEAIPVIGLGTWEVFDVAGTAEEMELRRQIVEMLIDKGGSLIDSSPMYNRSEKIVGDIVEDGDFRNKLFIATKVWTDGKARGESQMKRSSDLMKAEVIDLMQVHNLRDTGVHLATIREWQQDGRIRYNGITHYTKSAHDALARAMQQHKPQFIQINYSLGEPEAAQRVLPLAQDLGIGVLINRPYMTGRLFSAVRGRELPDWATEFADSWGQFFLKFIVSHPAVTCAIPATSKPHHMADNLGAGFGPMPDAKTREKMAAYWASL